MTNQEPISLGSLHTLKSKTKIIVSTVVLTVVAIALTLSILYFASDSYTKKNDANLITLKQVVIAYAPETRRIILVNRNTGQVQFALSDSVSLAIFALKYSEVVTDYSSSLTNADKLKLLDKKSIKKK